MRGKGEEKEAQASIMCLPFLCFRHSHKNMPEAFLRSLLYIAQHSPLFSLESCVVLLFGVGTCPCSLPFLLLTSPY